jgi:hypothetical protein
VGFSQVIGDTKPETHALFDAPPLIAAIKRDENSRLVFE